MTSVIAMPSITHAMKAQKVLQTRGYSCEVQRIKRGAPEGCGYSIQVNADFTTVMQILQQNKIPTLQSSTPKG